MKTNERIVMKRLFATVGVAATVFVVPNAVLAREPAACSDSEPAALDTRIGNVAAAVERALDSRTGSRADSNLRGLNTTNVGSSITIR